MIKRILSNVLEVHKSLDIEILRMLAYKYEEFDMFDESVEAYEQIISLKPSESQAYRNLALSYQLNKQYTKAQEVHNKIYNNKYTEVNSFSGLK